MIAFQREGIVVEFMRTRVLLLTFFIDEHGPFFADFKALIEEAYTSNGNRSVIIVTHSMGGPMTQVGPLTKTVKQNLTQS